MVGIKTRIRAEYSGNLVEVEPGLISKDIIVTGVHIKDVKIKKSMVSHYKFEFSLNGSESLRFIPVGKENLVTISSNWKTPSFSGAFLPRGHSIDQSGFESTWHIINLNRNYPQSWDGALHELKHSAFGVDLYVASDLYKKSTRAIKYALLFVIFTFSTFFCIELLNGNRIHPFQYLLVGLSISIFYILLVSISEHSNFDISYLISSVATVLLIGAYTKSIFIKNKITVVIMSLLSILYTYLYILMQLEDLALLVGSLGLFIGLATIMFITRKIDWYELSKPTKNTSV